MAAKEYAVLPAQSRPALNGLWDSGSWQEAPILEVACFRSESSGHRPRTRVKLLYCPEGLCGLFQVRDRYIRCLRQGFQEAVYKDSCVEFFVRPKPEGGYFNFEFNCGGALLASYIEDPARTPHGFKKFTPLTPEEGKQIKIYHSLPRVIEPEIEQETLWYIEFYLPFAVLERYAGKIELDLDIQEEKIWRANFYKCGDETSHPHWAAWAEVEELNFHAPRCFGALRFKRPQAEV